MRRVSRIAWGDAPRRHGLRHAHYGRAEGAESTGCVRYFDGRTDIQTRQAAASRDLRKARGARRDKAGVLDRSRDCRGDRGGRGGEGGIPSRAGDGDPRHHRRRTRGRGLMSKDTPQSPQETARQLHLWGFTQQCGSESSSSRDGGSSRKTNQLTSARAADAVPGAVDSPAPLRTPCVDRHPGLRRFVVACSRPRCPLSYASRTWIVRSRGCR